MVYQYLPYSIRVRVISSEFEDKTLGQQDRNLKRILTKLALEDEEHISMLMMLTPDEAVELDLMLQEFDRPGSSRF